jgi:hypothetical protein
MSNGTKHRIDIMSRVKKADWNKMSIGKNCLKKCRMGHNAKGDKTANGTKHRIGHIVEYRLCFIFSTVYNFRVFKKQFDSKINPRKFN